MKKSMVVFDMDDVLNLMFNQTSKIFSDISGINLSYEDWTTMCCIQLYGVEFDADLMIEKQLLENVSIAPDAQKVFKDFENAGYKTAIVTARSWHPNAINVTEEWLSKQGVSPTELHIVGYGDNSSKESAFTDISKKFDIHGFIDDQPKYLEQALKHPSVNRVFALDHPWNRKVENVERVHSLTEFYNRMTQ